MKEVLAVKIIEVDGEFQEQWVRVDRVGELGEEYDYVSIVGID